MFNVKNRRATARGSGRHLYGRGEGDVGPSGGPFRSPSRLAGSANHNRDQVLVHALLGKEYPTVDCGCSKSS